MTGLRVAVQSGGAIVWPIEHQRGCLTVIEAAEWLRISRAKLYELLAAGELRSFKIGRSRRIPTAELDRFVRQRIDRTGPR